MKKNVYNVYIAACLLLGCLTSCEKNNSEDKATTPTLSDITIVGKTASTVTLEGEIIATNGSSVTEKGINWGTGLPLDIDSDFKKPLHDVTDKIQLTADNLKGSTTYYFRLYAKNEAGIGYSNIDSTKTKDGLGNVRTFVISEQVHATTALAGGIIDLQGEGTILERGIYYSLLSSMEIKDSIISTMEKDSFVCYLSGLNPSTNYYVRAYVKNTFGIFTGSVFDLYTDMRKPISE